MVDQVNKTLSKHYYQSSQPGAYGGAVALQRQTNIDGNKVREWLSHQDTYTLHKPICRQFKRRVTITGGMNHQFQADLIDMRTLRKYNDGVSYLLTCIDVLSKYAWAIPVKTKTGTALVEALSKIFRKRRPLSLQTDKGSEFMNRNVQRYLRDRGVHFFTSENEDVKAAIVERFNRTLKEKMWRYFTKTNGLRYVDVITKLIRNYNHSYHRSIRMAPVEVTLANQEQVWKTLYADVELSTKSVFNEGDRVRISQARQTFKKGYTPAWTEELFTVSRVIITSPITYRLKDDSGEELQGTFYKEELQKVGDKEVFRIETVLDERRGLRGGKEYLVKWFGYTPAFNSWISDTQLANYEN